MIQGLQRYVYILSFKQFFFPIFVNSSYYNKMLSNSLSLILLISHFKLYFSLQLFFLNPKKDEYGKNKRLKKKKKIILKKK